MDLPQYVFKIVTSTPDLHSEKVQATQLDDESGFVHLSSGHQIPKVCDLFFSSSERLYIIKLPVDKVRKDIKWEAAADDGELFPHLFGDLLVTYIDSVREFKRAEGSWLDVLGKESWLSN